MACHAERAARAAARNAAGCRRRRSWRVRGRSSWLTWHVRCTRSRCGRRRRRISVRPPVPLSLARSPLLAPSLAPASARRVVRCASHSACRLACCVQARFARIRSRCSLTHTRAHAHARAHTYAHAGAGGRALEGLGGAAQGARMGAPHARARARRGVRFATPPAPTGRIRKFRYSEVSRIRTCPAFGRTSPQVRTLLALLLDCRVRSIRFAAEIKDEGVKSMVSPKLRPRGAHSSRFVARSTGGLRGARLSQCRAAPDGGGSARRGFRPGCQALMMARMAGGGGGGGGGTARADRHVEGAARGREPRRTEGEGMPASTRRSRAELYVCSCAVGLHRRRSKRPRRTDGP
jgi:hypothetical protein